MRKRTLRKLSPITRKYAKLLDELQSVVRRGRNLITDIESLELDSQALKSVKSRTMPQDLTPIFPPDED